MRLSQVIAGAGCSPIRGAGDPEIESITADSRQVRPGSLFVCVAGGTRDGHDFVDRAIADGAAAVIAGRELAGEPAVPFVMAEDTRRGLALAAANLYGHPDERVALAGITGTNGKTTVSFLFASIAEAAGSPCGLVGTVGIRVAREPGREASGHLLDGGDSGGGAAGLHANATVSRAGDAKGDAAAMRPATHTTPDAVALTRILAEMADGGVRHAALEVSSHALDQSRVAGLRFRAAGFTNLTRDHLDYHGDMESYFLAKARLFRERLHAGAVSVLNHDDPYGRRLAAMLDGAAWRYSVSDPEAELFASGVELAHDGIRAQVRTPQGAFSLRSGLIGAHNLQNLLCAAGLALASGFTLSDVERGLDGATGAPGRLERVGERAFVDYAHTPDALARVCAALREVAPARLVVVFGCGGDRDAGKRPLMGEAAGRGADLAVVTSDNPRSEDPAAIADAIVPGLEAAGRARVSHVEAVAGDAGFAVELDRRAAIDLAVAALGPGDLLLVAGKGHETTQTFADRAVHFDDREELRRALGIAG